MSDAYHVLAALSGESADLVLSARCRFLWRALPRLDEAVQAALAPLGETLYLEGATIYVDDPRFRQGATAMLLDYRLDRDDPFRIRATSLVDHGQIALRVLTAPLHPRFDRIRRMVEPSSSVAAELPLNRLGPA